MKGRFDPAFRRINESFYKDDAIILFHSIESMISPYRILHIDTDKTWRGGQQQVVSLIQQLQVMGHCSELVCPPDSVIRERISPLCETFPIPMRNELDMISAFQLGFHIREYKPDILHAHSGRAHSIALLSRFVSRQPVPVVVSRRVDFPIKKHLFSRWKYNQADFFIPISTVNARILLDAGIPKNKIRVVPSSVDPDRFTDADDAAIRQEFSIPADSLVVGNIAVCEERKRQVNIVEAAPRILQQFPHGYFIIVGDGPLLPALKDRAKELGVEQHVLFPGFRSDIGSFLKLFDIFLLIPNLEGLGSSILDAQYFSLPVIATDIGGIPDIVQDGKTGFLVPVDDVSALENRLLQLLSDSNLRDQMGRAAYQQVKNRYLASHMASQTVEIYGEAIHNKKNSM